MAQGYGRGCTSAILAAMAVMGVSACERGGNSGSTTIVQTVAPTSASAAPTSTTPSVSPINDKTKLCSRAIGQAQRLIDVTDAYWNLVTKDNLSQGDEKVVAAAGRVSDTAGKVIPALKALVGPEAPAEVADAIRKFTDIASQFTDAIGAHSAGGETNPLAHQYGDSIDNLTQACK